MEKLIKLLEENNFELTDELKNEIEEIYPVDKDTSDLFSQNELNEIVKKRLARDKKLHEQEINELKSEMEGLVAKDKLDEYEGKIKELENKSKLREEELKIDYELQLAAKDEGVNDLDYFEFLLEKNGFKNRLKVDAEGKVIAADSEGNIFTEDGHKLGPSVLIREMKEKNPNVFNEKKDDDSNIGGGGNPKGSTVKDKLKNTKNLALELGYKKKDKE